MMLLFDWRGETSELLRLGGEQTVSNSIVSSKPVANIC